MNTKMNNKLNLITFLKHKFTLFTLVLFVSFFVFNWVSRKLTVNSDSKKASYSLGYAVAQLSKNQDLDIDADAFVMGMKDMQKEKSLPVPPEDLKKAFQKLKAEACGMGQKKKTNPRSNDLLLSLCNALISNQQNPTATDDSLLPF